jgi:UDP-glucose 4-epimerase
MNVFITGGAGFIGSHLAECLIKDGHHVFVLDDLSTGQMRNLENLIGNRFFAYVIGSVRTRALVEELVDLCDVTVHLAAAVGVRLIVEQPVRTIETNVHGTEVVLEAAAKKQKPLLIASSSEVYGKSTNVPFKEAMT